MENDIQQELFKVVRTKIPDHLSAADEIAKILAISADSAYRRMRGEKPVSLDEVSKLCSHFKISVDQLMNIQTNAFLFFGKNVNSKNFSLNEYLGTILEYMNFMQKFKSKELYYMCKDIPIFHHFPFRDLGAFKYYFWMKSLLHFPDFNSRKFSLDEYPDQTFEIGRKILKLYNQMTSYELWNFESLNSTLRQIEFYHDSNLFVSDVEVARVYDALENFIDHLQKQAELGYKFDAGDASMTPLGGFKMYFNEVVALDNSALGVLDGSKVAFQNHTVLNVMMTRDIPFCDHVHETVQMLMRKSTLISSVSEKERLRFFKRMREKIQSRKRVLNTN
jgi:plasmid maintenance system antidote protein VapI